MENVSLLHCPNQRVPDALSAVVMKAMATAPEDRYQSVVELQADLTSHQGGFATKAERASWWRQGLLFGARHKRELAIFFAFAIIIQALLVAFIVELSRGKNLAQANAKRAIASETRAKASEEDLAKALLSLRGTAPTYAQEAKICSMTTSWKRRWRRSITRSSRCPTKPPTTNCAGTSCNR